MSNAVAAAEYQMPPTKLAKMVIYKHAANQTGMPAFVTKVEQRRISVFAMGPNGASIVQGLPHATDPLILDPNCPAFRERGCWDYAEGSEDALLPMVVKRIEEYGRRIIALEQALKLRRDKGRPKGTTKAVLEAKKKAQAAEAAAEANQEPAAS